MNDVGNVVINIDKNNNRFIVFVTVADYKMYGEYCFEGVVLCIDQEHDLNFCPVNQEYLYGVGCVSEFESKYFGPLIGEITLNKDGLVSYFNLERLNAIAVEDDTWRKEAEYRRDNRERLLEEAKQKLIELKEGINLKH